MSPRSKSFTNDVDEWPRPRWLTPVDSVDIERGDGSDFVDFAQKSCRITKDSIGGFAGQLMTLRPWQADVVSRLLARKDGGSERGPLKHRQALIGVPRKNGKSALGASLALFELIFGPRGGEVYSIAADKDQARIVFGTAKRMIQLDPVLSEWLKPYRDVIEFERKGSVYRVLSAEAYTKEGLNPHFVLADEVHAQPNRDLWDTLSLASGARVEPLMVGITTAGARFDTSGNDSLCYGLYEHGIRVATGETEDPVFFMAWWEPANPEADHRDPATWHESNPGLGDLVSVEDFASSVLRTPEAEFRIKRTNQWVTSTDTWLPYGAWDSCAEPGGIEPGTEVTLGFDGSFNGDCTALVVCSIEERPHIDVVELWERPREAMPDWQVPILDVEEEIRQACARYQVREIVCDPYRWARSYQILESEMLPVVEFPQSPSRMTPATTRFYEGVMNHKLSHSGDPRLARHIGNAVLKADTRGTRIYKEHRGSKRVIDLAVAAVMAYDRAAFLYGDPGLPFYGTWR